MKNNKNFSKSLKQIMSLSLAILLTASVIVPCFPLMQTRASYVGDEVTLLSAHGDTNTGHKLYCIDKGGLAVWGIADSGDKYKYHKPSESEVPLSTKEQEYIFWGLLTLQASKGEKKANELILAINEKSLEQRKMAITTSVSEEDLKALIYLPSVRNKYSWLENVAANTEEYLKMAGLLANSDSGDGITQGGKKVPTVIASHTNLTTAYPISRTDFIIPFDAGGADANFINKVPLMFSHDNGITFTPTPTDSWTYTKTNSSITFSNPDPQPPKALIRFETKGTEYASTGGTYLSKEDLFENCLQIWECISCSGTHGGKTPPNSPPWHHQRMVWLEMASVPVQYYAALAGDPGAGGTETGITFHVFRHEEDFKANYNVQLYKYDHETGKPLEGAQFVLYERFDDKDKIDTSKDGPVHIYEGGAPYASYYKDNPVIWDGFRKIGTVNTDDDGHATKTIEHGYHYDKTFCNGHPAPVFTEVPEPEEEEEDPENPGSGGEILNADEIAEAQTKNRGLAEAWNAYVSACANQASEEFSGVHFHWMMSDIDEAKISDIASTGGDEGSTPDGGNTTEPDEDTAYKSSGCYEDMQHTYDKFITLKYSYALTEFKAKDGYIRHDVHPEDIPVEIITTDASENGANAFFSGIYSSKDRLDQSSRAYFMVEKVSKTGAAEPASANKTEKLEICKNSDFRTQKANLSLQDVIVYAPLPENESETLEAFKEEDAERKTVRNVLRVATSSDAASPSKADFHWEKSSSRFRGMEATRGNAGRTKNTEESLFRSAYEMGLLAGSSGVEADTGESGHFSHCNFDDQEGEAWRIYDHRTEGEFHINKKDLDLAAGESEQYSAYGDSQGDGTLEGAVYGLFAAEDIIHPDGKTGTVYRANNIVSIAATDKNGDASFLVYTEAPGYIYDYTTGLIQTTQDGWTDNAPKNLYTANQSIDDYTKDGQHERTYQNNQNNNGNCWIGRPLIMGGYYVKELSRSEGYELSIGNKQNAVTNKDQDRDAQMSESGKGYAAIMEQVFADEQTSDDGKGAGPNELFFSARSKDTANQKYNIALSNIPTGTWIYRKDIGTKQVQVEVGTGTYEKVFLTNQDGTPRYIRAENDYQYPKYHTDGSLMVKETPTNYMANSLRQVSAGGLERTKVKEILERADGAMTDEENQTFLLMPFEENLLPFVKGKTEAALRRNGKGTPKTGIQGGGYDYSSIYVGVFDSGIREGDVDSYGLSGVTPGTPAAYTVYGNPIQQIAIKKEKSKGEHLTVGDAILSILNYYNSNPYYSYGGIDEVEEKGDNYLFTVYAGVQGTSDDFMVRGNNPERDSLIFHTVKYIPEDTAQPPRIIYATYSNHSDDKAFGTYENYREDVIGSSVVGNAALITDAVADGTGNLQSKVIKENIYYQTGELVRDSGGNLIQAFDYKEITATESKDVEEISWTKIPAAEQGDGTCVISVNAAYTDAYGVDHTNVENDETIEFKAVLKEKKITLSAEEAALLGSGFTVGHSMNSASYYAYVKKARVKAYLNDGNNIVGDNTYIRPLQLVYESQEYSYQDGGTRTKAAQLYERAIRQKIKIVKDIQITSEGIYARNTNEDIDRQDRLSAAKLDNFRFKIYLKSNLERIYRDSDGAVNWIDRNGNRVLAKEYRKNYPKTDPFGSVQKLYTKVQHKLDSKTTGSVSNNVVNAAVAINSNLYPYGADDLIASTQNEGYTRLLETVIRTMKDETGKTQQVEVYNYEKFFDAIQTANHDKWDRQENGSTSFKPFPFIRKPTDIAKDNALPSDAVRQFAITWYLDDEVKKLLEDNGASENQSAGGSENDQEEVYDKALWEAKKKAENYLKPFFANDLDEIYAVAWDSDSDGGSDKDQTTLSADTLYPAVVNVAETSKKEYFYGISNYMPYGAYVIVEQQPYDKKLGDLYNKHYQTDQPKEIVLPAVYEQNGNEEEPEKLKKEYEYRPEDRPEDFQRKYFLRFNEEWADNHTDDLRKYVIRGHNADGNFEVYKYGLKADHLTGAITYGEETYQYSGFRINQEIFDPYKDIYETENVVSDYQSNQMVEKYYRYGSISEAVGTADKVLYQREADTEDKGRSGMYVKDKVKTVTGALTAYDGLFASALVPWTVKEPVNAGTYDPDRFFGYAEAKFHNTLYSSKLRIEKLDSETGENILHDGAVFAVYSASREENRNSDGLVQFYKQDTMITGSKEFLEAMGAREITPVAKAALSREVPYLGKYYGTVSAGTPICREADQIIMTDTRGAKTGEFRAFTTTKDGQLQNENGVGIEFSDQNVGYLTTPQSLLAGCYVLAEIKAPAGYVKSKPIAIELYSDQISYYLGGNKDRRVLAAIYEEEAMESGKRGNEIARVYVNNTPIQLEVSKVKSPEMVIPYELNGRLEGSAIELGTEYGLENLELAYNDSGKYLHYGWKKGFLDSLKQKQAAGENLEILYEDGVFTGKAKLLQLLETAGDENRYLPGATMTLYDAIEVMPSGDGGDYGYEGVNVKRDQYGNVKNIYVQKGYAGTEIKYVLNKNDLIDYTYDQQEDDKGDGTWTYKTIGREDTDILFYDLGSLTVFTVEKKVLYGHDREGKKIQVKNGESIYAFKNGTAYLEIICSDYEKLKYSVKDRLFENVPEGTNIYHLDRDGNRDSEIDPYTGMAYVREAKTGKIFVWPVKIAEDQYGNLIARDKKKTSRIATVEAGTEKEYTVGTYDSHTNSFKKSVNPVLNEHGQPVYYQRSNETYQKGFPMFDRDGDYVRYRYVDALKLLNDNAYRIKTNSALKEIGEDPESAADDVKLYHRQGEAYLIENTWTTGEKTPNDPFQTEMTKGQKDILKRIPSGTYILEEVKAPAGFIKTMPLGVTVNGTAEVQMIKATDRATGGYFEKLDAPMTYQVKVADRDAVLTEAQSSIRTEGKGGYTYQNVKGALLTLYHAKRVRTSDLTNFPSGYYLEKIENKPASWKVFDDHNNQKNINAQWRTDAAPKYLEAIPKGDYILEETEVPDGYMGSSMEIEIKEWEGLQHFILPNDHTKIEIFKYIEKDGKKVSLPKGFEAKLALYEAVTDNNGIVMDHGVPQYKPDREVDEWLTEDGSSYTDFTKEFESLYREYSSGFENITWKDGEDKKTAKRIENKETDKKESVRQLWETANGSQVLVQITKNLLPTGYYGWDFDYKINYKQLAGNIVSYDTLAGNHRIDYLPLNGENKKKEREGYYVLVETRTPEGFAAVTPRGIVITETKDIQLYALKNEPKYLFIEKISEDQKSIKGAELALYQAAEDGSLLMDAAHLVDQWISDGIKPHYLSPVPYGTYYLTELVAPLGYEKMLPQKIEVTADSDPVIKAVNILKKGILKLEKYDADQSDLKLSGAKFKVTNQATGASFYFITDDRGQAVSELLPIGTTDETGVWKPYRYEVCEIKPPETYQLNLTQYIFSFEDQSDLSKLTYHLSVPDKQTAINITKSDFSSNMLVKGAVLAIYGTKVIDGRYEANGEALETWVTDQNTHTIKGKLAAGRVYVLKELKAPQGYHTASPVLLTISEDGRRITSVTDNFNMVNFKTSENNVDAVESVIISGRQAIETVLLFTDLDTGKMIQVPAGKEYLAPEDGLIEGHRYEEKEITRYSDGNEKTSERTIFRLSFDQEGCYPVNIPMPEKTTLRLETGEGELIEAWVVENQEKNGYSHRIFNPEYEEGQGIQAASLNGRYGSGMPAGSIVCYEASYRNNEKEKKDIKITVILDNQVEYMPANSTAGGKKEKESVTWTIRNVFPGESGNIKITAAVKEDAKHEIQIKAVIGEKKYECKNPISEEGSLTVTSTLSGTAGEELENTGFEYKIYLRNDRGEPLKGTYQYAGSKKGTLKSGDTIVLRGGEFITITGMVWGTNYEVAVKSPEKIERSEKGTKGLIRKEGVSAVFLYKKNDSSVRAVLKKGETYHLTETTVYSDGRQLQSNKLSFTLGENASIEGIDMKDHPTHVIISKTKITGGPELPGAHLMIKDEIGTIVKEWISTNNPQELIAVLEPGKTYFLTEIAPPDGYVCAKTIEFTISEDGSIDHIRMEDDRTNIEIVKIDESGETMLAGAYLEVRDETGILVERWVSDGTPHKIVGKLKAGATYILKETKAPKGYIICGPVTFIVLESTPTIIRIANRKEPIIPDNPSTDKPDKPDKPIIIGSVTAEYVRIFAGTGNVEIGRATRSKIPWLGDMGDNIGINAAAGLLTVFIFLLLVKKRRR